MGAVEDFVHEMPCCQELVALACCWWRCARDGRDLRCLEVPRGTYTTDFCLLVPAATYAGRLLPPGVQATVSHDHGKIKVHELYVASRRERGGIHSFRSFVAQGFDTCEHISNPIGISGDIGKGGAQRGIPGSKMSPIT